MPSKSSLRQCAAALLARSRRVIKEHGSYLGLVLILYSLLALGAAYANNWYDPPFSQTNDLTVHIPYAFKLADSRLYARDPVFGHFGWTSFGNRLDSLPFPVLLRILLPVLGGIRSTLGVLSFVLGLTFVVGIYFLTCHFCGDSLAGVIAAFLASLDYKVLGGVYLSFALPNVLPRNFVAAISPFVVILFLRWRETKRLWILYALLGLAANFHALAPLHLVLILTLALIVTSGLSWLSIKKLITCGAASLIGALPVLLAFVPSLGRRLDVTSEEALILANRYSFAFRPDLGSLLCFGVNFLPLALLGGLGFYLALKRQDVRRTTVSVYLTLYGVVLLLPWIGQIINSFTFSFSQLELLRVTRYYFVLNFAPLGLLLANWLRRRRRILSILVLFVLIVLMTVSRPLVGVALVSKGFEWFLARQGPPVVIESVATESRSEQPVMVWNWYAFVDLCDWVDSNTPVDALFLAPVDWNSFRVYARRGLAVSWKGTEWEGWAEHYETVLALYNSPDAHRFVDVARDYDVDYVVVMPGLDLPDFDVVYENGFYVVYKVE